MARRHRTRQRLRLPLHQRLAAALPSSLAGLVTFSFVILGLGTAVYVAALPSLVTASPVVSQALDGSPEDPSGNSAAGNDATAGAGDKEDPSGTRGAYGATADGTDSGDLVDGASYDGAATGDATLTGTLPDLTDDSSTPALSGASSSDAGSVDAADGTADGDSSKDDENAEDSGSNSQQQAGSSQQTSKSGTSKTSGASKAGTNTSNANGTSSSTTTTNAASDKETHDYLVSKAQEVKALREELNALNSEASTTFVSDLATREASQRHAVAFKSKAMSASATMTNTQVSSSRYDDQRGRLIGMYRCLFQCGEVLEQAWAQNLDPSYDDASAHQSELGELYDSAMAAEQGYLDEYNGYAQGLSL